MNKIIPERFRGFHPPSSNTTYCPNQFLDVCMPHYSRPCVRLVGYMIRKTLGWSDAQGRPLEEEHRFTWKHLITYAGISRGAMAQAIKEAVRGGFIEQKIVGKAKARGRSFTSSVFTLRWSDSPSYVKDPKSFRGFFAGEGNRTYIPNQFFDVVLCSEPLGVIKVVGSIIRFSIGFQTKFGFRRQQVQQSITAIQNYTRQDRKTVRLALQAAVEAGYLTRLDPGRFDPNAGLESRAATYSLNWLQNGSVQNATWGIDSKSPTEALGQRSNKTYGIGSKTGTENRFKIPHGRNNKENKTPKQQPVAAEKDPMKRGILETLTKLGFRGETANFLVREYPLAVIQRQAAWIHRRNPKNVPAMLRRAIENDWAEPGSEETATDTRGRHQTFVSGFYAGLANHSGRPVAKGSRRDLENACLIVSQMISLPKGNDPAFERKGREFGRFVRARTPKEITHSFASALRIHGDAWLRQELKMPQSHSKNNSPKKLRRPELNQEAKLQRLSAIRRELEDRMILSKRG